MKWKPTKHRSSKESTLRHPNLIPILAKEPPLNHRRCPPATIPFPCTKWQITHCLRANIAAYTPPLRPMISKHCDHCVEGTKSPCNTSEHEVPKLPQTKLSGVMLEHLIHANPFIALARVLRDLVIHCLVFLNLWWGDEAICLRFEWRERFYR